MRNNFTVVFDLDGTLIDSQASVLGSIKIALDESGIKSLVPLTPELIGPPLLETLSVICGTNDLSELSCVITRFKDVYDNFGYRNSIRYHGVDELLERLIDDRITLSLVTNKRRVPTEKILDHFDWHRVFTHVYTIDSGCTPFKNKTEALAALLCEKMIEPANSVYIGDRQEDFEAAINNNMRCLLVHWGYGLNNMPDLCGIKIKTTDELAVAIKKIMQESGDNRNASIF